MSELRGQKVLLRPLSKDDLDQRALWTADPELSRLMGANPDAEPFVSHEVEVVNVERWFAGRQRAHALLYAIEVDGDYIGDIDVTILPDVKRAEFSVCIGPPSRRGSGYGTEAMSLILAYVTTTHGVRSAEVDVVGTNDNAYAFWSKLGFTVDRTDDDGRRWMRWGMKESG